MALNSMPIRIKKATANASNVPMEIKEHIAEECDGPSMYTRSSDPWLGEPHSLEYYLSSMLRCLA